MYKQEQKRRAHLRRRLSRTQALLGRVIPGGWILVSETKMRSVVGLSAHSEIHLMIRPLRRKYVVVLVRKLMSCCAAGTNGYLDLRRRASPLDGWLSAEWSRYPGSMARRPRDNVAPLLRSSAGRMPARIGRLSADAGRRHPVTILKASLMAGILRRV